MDNKELEQTIEQANWYVVHTYSGHENKVASKIENMIENGKAHNVFDVRVPMEKYEDNKGGKKTIKERKIFPGYVLIKMIIDSRNWYLIRNTKGVTGFIGPDGDPVALTPKEIKKFGIEGEEAIEVKINPEDFKVQIGDTVEFISGPFEGFEGKVTDINYEKQVVTALIDILGGDTRAEIEFTDIKQ